MDETATTAPADAPAAPAAPAEPAAPTLPAVPPASEHAAEPAPHTEAQTLTPDKFPSDQVAQMDDKSVLFFGVVPLVIIGVLAVAAVALYFIRRGKNWNELGDAMRIDDGDKPVTSDDSFNTRDIAEMEPTKPSQRITELSRHHSKPE